jgi:carbonic anhydrase
MSKTSTLISGNSTFLQGYAKKNEDLLIDLSENGQKPQALFVGCSDSRVVPNLITQTNPGQVFVVRNIGNFVPPYNEQIEHSSVASAIEYGVKALKIKELIVCGHTQCGAIAALYSDLDPNEFMHVSKWLEQGKKVKDRTLAALDSDVSEETLLRATEQFSVVAQLENLLSYPFIKKMVDSGDLEIHGWMYNIKTGDIQYYDQAEKTFQAVSEKDLVAMEVEHD